VRIESRLILTDGMRLAQAAGENRFRVSVCKRKYNEGSSLMEGYGAKQRKKEKDNMRGRCKGLTAMRLNTLRQVKNVGRRRRLPVNRR